MVAGNRYVHDRAVFNATSASGTKIHINTACAFFNFDGKVSGRPFDRFKICVGNNFYVQVPADLDQFR
ncbi:MAG: hypothetical protein BBJ57_08575 [Desulfobacterales bacterium PC51MH44]|nr:MAG: hypothetical protein BBJ57_08575 [Desulfobacterales bacterium PC51MH44]